MCLSYPSSEVRLCVSMVLSLDIAGGGGNMSTKCTDAE